MSQTIVPNPSICAPSWILIASPSFSSTAASASSEVSGVYGVTNEDGETVVGWEMPIIIVSRVMQEEVCAHLSKSSFHGKLWQSPPPITCHLARKLSRSSRQQCTIL